MTISPALRPKVYIITLNWNRAKETIECVNSLLANDYPNFCVLICDNASRVDDVAILEQWVKGPATGRIIGPASQDDISHGGFYPGSVTLLHTGGNLGYAGGMNVGLRVALRENDAAYFWILNNDTVIDSSALTVLVERMERDSSIGICGSSLVYFENRAMVQAYGGATYQKWRARSSAIGAFSSVKDIPLDSSQVEAKTDYVIGAAMLVSEPFLLKVGLMDESFFLYSEEQDWAYRGRRNGFKLGYAPASIVYHHHGATIGTSPSGGSPLSLFYLYRNKAVFAARYYKPYLPISLAFLLLDGVKQLVKGRPSKAWAILRGLVSAPFGGRY